MKLFIRENIDKYISTLPLRFHTPGHKGLIESRDITEIDDTFPGDCITRAEQKVAKLLGAKHCRFLVGGSSMGIKAAVLAIKGDILVAENSHRALFEAAKLAGVSAFTVQNQIIDNLPRPLSADRIERALNAHPSVKAVYITSPDYYGLTARGEIAEVVKNRAYLLCDGAHGAHFPFRPDLFTPSYSTTADIVNLSAHKTLPAFTQSAYLAINNDSLLAAVDEALTLLGTTSPSYMLLSGLEYAAEYTAEHAKRYDELFEAAEIFRRDIPVLENDDFTRLVVNAKALGLSGKQLYESLKSVGVVAEKYDEQYVVFIVTVVDDPQKIYLLKEKICAVSLLHSKAATVAAKARR